MYSQTVVKVGCARHVDALCSAAAVETLYGKLVLNALECGEVYFFAFRISEVFADR